MATSVTNAVATDAVAILLLNLPGDADRKCLYGPAEVLGDEFPVDEVALLFQVATTVASDGRASKALREDGSMRPRDVESRPGRTGRRDDDLIQPQASLVDGFRSLPILIGEARLRGHPGHRPPPQEQHQQHDSWSG